MTSENEPLDIQQAKQARRRAALAALRGDGAGGVGADPESHIKVGETVDIRPAGNETSAQAERLAMNDLAEIFGMGPDGSDPVEPEASIDARAKSLHDLLADLEALREVRLDLPHEPDEVPVDDAAPAEQHPPTYLGYWKEDGELPADGDGGGDETTSLSLVNSLMPGDWWAMDSNIAAQTLAANGQFLPGELDVFTKLSEARRILDEARSSRPEDVSDSAGSENPDVDDSFTGSRRAVRRGRRRARGSGADSENWLREKMGEMLDGLREKGEELDRLLQEKLPQTTLSEGQKKWMKRAVAGGFGIAAGAGLSELIGRNTSRAIGLKGSLAVASVGFAALEIHTLAYLDSQGGQLASVASGVSKFRENLNKVSDKWRDLVSRDKDGLVAAFFAGVPIGILGHVAYEGLQSTGELPLPQGNAEVDAPVGPDASPDSDGGHLTFDIDAPTHDFDPENHVALESAAEAPVVVPDQHWTDWLGRQHDISFASFEEFTQEHPDRFSGEVQTEDGIKWLATDTGEILISTDGDDSIDFILTPNPHQETMSIYDLRDGIWEGLNRGVVIEDDNLARFSLYERDSNTAIPIPEALKSEIASMRDSVVEEYRSFDLDGSGWILNEEVFIKLVREGDFDRAYQFAQDNNVNHDFFDRILGRPGDIVKVIQGDESTDYRVYDVDGDGRLDLVVNPEGGVWVEGRPTDSLPQEVKTVLEMNLPEGILEDDKTQHIELIDRGSDGNVDFVTLSDDEYRMYADVDQDGVLDEASRNEEGVLTATVDGQVYNFDEDNNRWVPVETTTTDSNANSTEPQVPSDTESTSPAPEGVDLDGDPDTLEITYTTDGFGTADVTGDGTPEEVKLTPDSSNVIFEDVEYKYNSDTGHWNPIGEQMDLNGDEFYDSIQAGDGNYYADVNGDGDLEQVTYDGKSGTFVTNEGEAYTQNDSGGFEPVDQEDTAPAPSTNADEASKWQEARNALEPLQIDPDQSEYTLRYGDTMTDVARGLSEVNGMSQSENLLELYRANSGLFAQDNPNFDTIQLINQVLAEDPNAGVQTPMPGGGNLYQALMSSMNNLTAGQSVRLP